MRSSLCFALLVSPVAAFAQLSPPNTVISATVDYQYQSNTLRYFADAETTACTTSLVVFTVAHSSLGPSASAGFCTELEETIGRGTHPFRTTYDVQRGARGTANSGTPTYDLPTGLGAGGGIGASRAQRLNRLFSQHYVSDASSTYWSETLTFTGVPGSSGTQGTITVPHARTYAFQLAVWALAFSDNPGYLSTSGGPVGT